MSVFLLVVGEFGVGDVKLEQLELFGHETVSN